MTGEVDERLGAYTRELIASELGRACVAVDWIANVLLAGPAPPLSDDRLSAAIARASAGLWEAVGIADELIAEQHKEQPA
jgi:hypothetical protein